MKKHYPHLRRWPPFPHDNVPVAMTRDGTVPGANPAFRIIELASTGTVRAS
jgi:hypothetical protein